jgi:DNA-directed RNA polymerase III subunit RPC6
MAATAPPVRVADELSILKDQLYSACQDAFPGDYDKTLSQDDLMGLDVIPPKDIKKLMDVVSILTKERLFAPVNHHSGLAWRVRTEAEAAK